MLIDVAGCRHRARCLRGPLVGQRIRPRRARLSGAGVGGATAFDTKCGAEFTRHGVRGGMSGRGVPSTARSHRPIRRNGMCDTVRITVLFRLLAFGLPLLGCQGAANGDPAPSIVADSFPQEAVVRDSSFALAALSAVGVDVVLDAVPGRTGELFGLTPGEQARMTDGLRHLVERRLRERGISVIGSTPDSVKLWVKVRPLAAALGQNLVVMWTVDLGVGRTLELPVQPGLRFRSTAWRRSRSAVEVRGLGKLEPAVTAASEQLMDGLIGEMLVVADTLRQHDARRRPPSGAQILPLMH